MSSVQNGNPNWDILLWDEESDPAVSMLDRLLRSLHTLEYKRYIAVLIQARKKAGLTQQAVAALLGKPQSFVSKYERSERRLDVPEFIALARAIGVAPRTLLRNIEAVL